MEKETFYKAAHIIDRISCIENELAKIEKMGAEYIICRVNSYGNAEVLIPKEMFAKYEEAALKEVTDFLTKELYELKTELQNL